MSNVLIDKTKIDNLANAISVKSGESVPMTLTEMTQAVDGIDTSGGGGGITPTGNIDITQAGVTDVTNYATATVPQGEVYVSCGHGFFTSSGVRKWQYTPNAQVYLDDSLGAEGFITDGYYEDGEQQIFNAVPSGTTVTPTTSTQTIGGANYMMEGAVTVSAMPSGSVTAPSTITGTSATVSTGTNTLTLSKTVSVTPNVTTSGYVSSGTAGNSNVSLTASVTTKGATTYTPTTTNQTISSGTYLTGTQTISGDANLVAGNIKSGTTIFGVTGTYSGGGGGSLSYDTKTATASNYPVSLSFTSMKGEPKFFAVRLNAQVSSSGSTTYYYIVDIVSNCNGSSAVTHGNCFRIGNTRRVDNITSGYSYTYSGTTLTITSSAASRSASPGAFYSGSYELIYAY